MKQNKAGQSDLQHLEIFLVSLLLPNLSSGKVKEEKFTPKFWGFGIFVSKYIQYFFGAHFWNSTINLSRFASIKQLLLKFGQFLEFSAFF